MCVKYLLSRSGDRAVGQYCQSPMYVFVGCHRARCHIVAIEAMDLIKYCLFYYWEAEADPRTVHYPLMQGGPLLVFVIITLYVLFVKMVGPVWMRHREPFRLKKILVIYNLYNVLVNVWFFVESIYCLDYGRKLYDFKFPSKENRSAKSLHCCTMIYIYMLSKFVDMADTIFFVLRKKNDQASFLHVYHHSIVPLLMWMAVKLMPCAGPAGLFPLLNSFIHAIMYFYYTMAALGPRYHKHILFWKKYITMIQLSQFVCYIVHATLFLFLQSGYPIFVVYLAYVQNPFFLIMFYQFFRATYQPRNKLISKSK